MLSRPNADEYFEYYGKYIALVPDGDVRDHLRTQLFETVALLEGVTDAKATRRIPKRSCRPPGGLPVSTCPAAPASAWTPGRTRIASSRRSTLRWSPSR